MYKSLISILSNLAPYTKSLCKESANALVYLVQVFSRKNFLVEKEDNTKVLSNLSETLSYLLAYQDEGNQRLQYSLLKNRENIESLDQMTLVENRVEEDQEEEEEEEEEVEE